MKLEKKCGILNTTHNYVVIAFQIACQCCTTFMLFRFLYEYFNVYVTDGDVQFSNLTPIVSRIKI